MQPIHNERMSETIDYYLNQCEEYGLSVVPADIKHIVLWGGAEMGSLDRTASASMLPNLETAFLSQFSGLLSNYAFANCSKLTEVTLSDQMTRLSGQCFMNCTRLHSIYQTDEVKVRNEADLSSIRGSAGLSTQAFQNCTSLTTVKLSSLKVESYATFSECSKLTTVYRKGTAKEEGVADLTSISSFSGGYNFRNTAIRTVRLPLNVDIPHQAFDFCYSLTSIQFYPSQTQRVNIGFLAFDRCPPECKAYMNRSLVNDPYFVMSRVGMDNIPKIAY